MIRLRITFNGFGGITTPVATVMSTLPDCRDFSVKQRTLLGVKTIGQTAVATAGMSLLKNRINFSFSVLDPGLVSALKRGLTFILRKPQWNSISVLAGMTSLLSKVRLILKCMVESLHSWGNKVDRIAV
jgi:hypothetical protein